MFMCRRITYIFLILQVLFCACGKEVHTTEEKPGGGGLVNPLHPGEDAVLTVATCNVLKPEGRRDEMSMELSIVRQALAGSIKDTKADIIGFNELDETLITNGRYSLKSLREDKDLKNCPLIKNLNFPKVRFSL